MKAIILVITICISFIGFSQEIQYAEITKLVEDISKSENTVNIWIKTGSDGTRKIYMENNDFDGLRNDEYYSGLEIMKIIFEYIFEGINYTREVPISMFELTQILQKKQILGMEFKTKNHLHLYSWEDIIK